MAHRRQANIDLSEAEKMSEVKYKYCLRRGDVWLYTDDLNLVQQLFGITQTQVLAKPKRKGKSFLQRTAGGYRTSLTASVGESTVKKVFEKLAELAREKPVTITDLLLELESARTTVERALLALTRLGKVRRYRGRGGFYLYTPTVKSFESEAIGNVVLSEKQRRAIESVGKALKQEWKLREEYKK